MGQSLAGHHAADTADVRQHDRRRVLPAGRFDPPFVATEHNGTWSKAEPAPGLLALSHGKAFQAGLNNVSCGAAGNCATTGEIMFIKARPEAIVANEVGGRWHRAEAVPGILKLEKRGFSRGVRGRLLVSRPLRG